MKKNWICTALLLGVIALAGCGDTTENQGENTPMPTATPTVTPTPTPFVPKVVGTFEAENGTFVGSVTAVKDTSCSGTGYVKGFQNVGDTCTITVTVEEDGFYDLVFKVASNGGEKTNPVKVDGNGVGNIYVDTTEYTDAVVERAWLTAGAHEVEVGVSWGWINLDSVTVQTAKPIDPSLYEVEAKLCNPNATDEAKRLMSYLTDIYGEYFLSGQVCDDGPYGLEFQVIKKVTGKMPAILGIDLMEYNPVNVEHGSNPTMVKSVINHWNNGGIAEVHWHWNVAEKYVTGDWYGSFYTKNTNINLKKIMEGKDVVAYNSLMADIDAIAKPLLELQEAGIPVLFRPLHEASGGWFWWGASGPEAYKKLYTLLYDKLTNEYGLNNLIWVWNGQNADWYPGDEYVDIVGEDIYPGEKVYTSQISKYLEVASYSNERKMVYLTECGCIFDPELAKRDGAMWGMWAVWQDEFVRKNVAVASISEQYTEEYMMKKAYEHELVLTLDELPDLKTYPISESFNK